MVKLVGEAGIEPTTPDLEGPCSIQLSYSPYRFIVSVGPGGLVHHGSDLKVFAPQQRHHQPQR